MAPGTTSTVEDVSTASTLKRSTLADTLLTRLREQILAGRPPAGSPMPTEREIGEAFGVGRTTVREALRGLEAAGFVVRQAKRLLVQDPRLVPDSEIDYGALAARASIQEVFATRKLLEVEGARLAATARTAEDVARMRVIVEQMDPADPESYQMHSMEFHTQVMLASGNRVLAQTYITSRHLMFKSSAFWKVFGRTGTGPIGQGIGGHLAILGAIELGDAGEAARATYQHLSVTEQALIRRVRTAESIAD
jgi:DNA-binding FadR family transcriptional regulator